MAAGNIKWLNRGDENRKERNRQDVKKKMKIYIKNDISDNYMLLLSTLLGMVSRLKYIVSNRARPPSTAGLGYGKRKYILLLIIFFCD